MTDNHKNIIKFLIKPIWEPATLFYKAMINLLKLFMEDIIEALKDEDGEKLWLGFTVFALCVVMLSMLFIGMETTFKIALITASIILIPIYLALYYIREKLR